MNDFELETQTINAFMAMRHGNGGELECSMDNGATWEKATGSNFMDRGVHYRVIKTKPKKKRVPLTADDLPFFFTMRLNQKVDGFVPRFVPLRVGSKGVYTVNSIGDIILWEFDKLTESLTIEYSTDGKTWHPFSKEVEV